MHPNPGFRWEDRAGMRALVRDLAFGTLFAATPDGPRVAQVPVVWLDDDTIGFHVARGNGITRHLDRAAVLFSVLGPDGYVSPDWYALDHDQVPTWNYVAVELEGIAHRMEQDALVAQLDRLSDEQEARIAALTGKTPWTRAKMDSAYFERLTRAIAGFRVDVTAWRGTQKLGQNKPEAARLAAADGTAATGRRGIAELMRRGTLDA